MEISVKRKVLMLFGFAAAMAIGGCGNREPENILPSGTDVAGLESVRAGNENGESRGNAGPGGATEPLQEDSRKDVPQGQILEQSFDVFLDGWGEVVFASFEPEEDLLQKDGIWEYGDARFMLLRDGQVIYTFPSMFEEDVMAGQQFGEVVSVSFRDYNVDGRPDVLLLLKYAGVQGIDIGQEWVEARAYTQEDGGADFYLDSAATEYINRNVPGLATMEEVVQVLAEYGDWYSVATGMNAWVVERFARGIRKDILAGDFQGLAEKIAFPIVIDGTTYSSKEDFLSGDFIQNTDRGFLEAIEQSPTVNMFCNWQGIMLGNGEVWFAEVLGGVDGSASQELKVVAVNGISGGQGTEREEPGDYRQQEDALQERMDYYMASAYYADITDYWENVRGVRDIANRTDFLFETDSRYYTAADLEGEPSYVIRLAKNEIYARHGYIFDDPDLYNYFMGCVWYMPTTAPKEFDTAVFNEYEKENVKVLSELDR